MKIKIIHIDSHSKATIFSQLRFLYFDCTKIHCKVYIFKVKIIISIIKHSASSWQRIKAAVSINAGETVAVGLAHSQKVTTTNFMICSY